MMLRTIMARVALTLGVGMLVFLAVSTPATADTTNGILEPHEGALLSGSTGINGIVNDPHFASYQIDLFPQGDAQDATLVARGTNHDPEAERLGTLNTYNFPNGDYQLRLRVIRTDGNYAEYSNSVEINNGLPGMNGITFPVDHGVLACLAVIQGIAHTDNFWKYQLDLLVGGAEDQVIPLGHGGQQLFVAGELGKVDTALVSDGSHVLRLRVVTRDGQYQSYYTPVTVNNGIMANALTRNACTCAMPDSTASPSNARAITFPADGETLHGTVPVCGNADNLNLGSWELDLLFNGDPDTSVTVARNNSANLNSTPFTLLDTTALPDGRYSLRLRVARLDDSFTESTISVCIQNNKTVQSPGTVSCAPSAINLLPLRQIGPTQNKRVIPSLAAQRS